MYSSFLRLIPLGIVGLVLLAAVYQIYVRSKKVTRSEIIRIFKSINILTAWGLIFTLLVTGVFAVFHHLKTKQYMSAVVSLNYSEASQAQNSNGTRYNMAEIICDEVVAKAIERGALENVTVKQLKNCLSVYPYIQGDVRDVANYHISTEFVVEYYASKHTQHLNAENVITLITGAYKEYYIEKYTDNFSKTAQREITDFSGMEYMDIVSYLNKETNSLLNYLYGMAQMSPSFVTSGNTTFQAIGEKVSQFKTTQIEQNLLSLILQNGIAKDKDSYIDRLSYQNTNLDFERQKHVASFNLSNEAVAMYAEEMTRVVLVPTWDYSGKYYMGRTKVGIDELSMLAASLSDYGVVKEKEIKSNQLVIDKMNTSIDVTQVKGQIDESIESITARLDAFINEAITAGREYANYRMNQCIAVNLSSVSLFSELKTVAVFAVFAYIAALATQTAKKFPKSANAK